MPDDYIEQIGEFDPMSSPATASGIPESADVVMDYTIASDNQTQTPVPNGEKVSNDYQDASYLIPKRVVVKRYRLKK